MVGTGFVRQALGDRLWETGFGKSHLIDSPTIVYPEVDGPYTLDTDASGTGLLDGALRPQMRMEWKKCQLLQAEP